MKKLKDVFVAYDNTNTTDGVGGRWYAYVICELKETAKRMSKNEGIQGWGCPVNCEKVVEINGEIYVNLSDMKIIPPSKEDVRIYENNEKYKKTLEHAEEILSKEELSIIRRGPL